MKELLHLSSTSLSHSNSLVFGMNKPNAFEVLFDLLDLPHEKEYFLVIHHDFWRQQGLHGLEPFQGILQVEAVPSFHAAAVVDLLCQQTIQDGASIILLIWQRIVIEALADGIRQVAIKRVLTDLVLFVTQLLPQTVVEMLDEVPLAAKEEVLHRLQMVLQVELVLEDVDQHCSDFFVCFGEPLIEGRAQQTVAISVFRELGLEIVDNFASIAQEEDSFASNKDLLCTFNVQNIRHILHHKLETLSPFFALGDPFVLSDEELTVRVQELSQVHPVMDVVQQRLDQET